MPHLQDSIPDKVIQWYELHGRKNLPWQSNNSYHVWISEIMLQQTQVNKVVEYFQNFIEKFPTLKLLAQAETQDVLTSWSGLGYYNRARNLHKAAQICRAEYSSQLPLDLTQLMNLPGIGKTTAGAILSLASNLSYPILDGNVKRVMSRLFTVGADKMSELNNKLWKIVTDLMPDNSAREYNQALMDLGSMICTRVKPLCIQCPLTEACQAYQLDQISAYPQKKPKTKQLKKTYYLLLLIDNNMVYLQQRDETGIWPQLWFLPVFDSKQALLSSKEFEGLEKFEVSEFSIKHILTHRILDLQILCIALNQKSIDNGMWIEPSKLKHIPHPTALVKIMQSHQSQGDR